MGVGGEEGSGLWENFHLELFVRIVTGMLIKLENGLCSKI